MPCSFDALSSDPSYYPELRRLYGKDYLMPWNQQTPTIARSLCGEIGAHLAAVMSTDDGRQSGKS